MTSLHSGSQHAYIRRRSYVAASTRNDPASPTMRRSRVAPIDYLKGQLTFLTQGQHTVRRLIDLVRERLETTWDELRSEDIGELEGWLRRRSSNAARGEAQIRWGFVRGVFTAIREARQPTNAEREEHLPSTADHWSGREPASPSIAVTGLRE
jgi:hypothetical protein